jgi:hypothetical protein
VAGISTYRGCLALLERLEQLWLLAAIRKKRIATPKVSRLNSPTKNPDSEHGTRKGSKTYSYTLVLNCSNPLLKRARGSMNCRKNTPASCCYLEFEMMGIERKRRWTGITVAEKKSTGWGQRTLDGGGSEVLPRWASSASGGNLLSMLLPAFGMEAALL